MENLGGQCGREMEGEREREREGEREGERKRERMKLSTQNKIEYKTRELD